MGCVCVCVCGGGGVPLEPFFPGAPSKINKQAISYFTVNWCFKPTTIVFIDDRFFQSAECFFHCLHDSLCNMIVVNS